MHLVICKTQKVEGPVCFVTSLQPVKTWESVRQLGVIL